MSTRASNSVRGYISLAAVFKKSFCVTNSIWRGNLIKYTSHELQRNAAGVRMLKKSTNINPQTKASRANEKRALCAFHSACRSLWVARGRWQFPEVISFYLCSQPSGKNVSKGPGRCIAPSVSPKRVENVINQCQDEVKLAIIQGKHRNFFRRHNHFTTIKGHLVQKWYCWI